MGALAQLNPLPSGIVTFVFTDIEGSTRLLRRLGDRYPEVLDRHRDLLRAEWLRYAGAEVETEGDSMLVAFSDPAAAVAACAAGQRALLREQWPADGTVRVRMGVHSGLAYPRGHGYVALAVHQAARVVAAAHGGQVVVSEQTADTATDLVDGVALASVGRFRLRDFDAPVQLFVVSAEALPRVFPSVRALPAQGHNLVRPSTNLVGRDEALVAVAELLASQNLVSIVGPGGVGKTRLVTELGLQVALAWPDGVWFIDLSPLQSAALIPTTVATAIGCSLPTDAEPWSAVLEHLRQRKALLIFDNCEHVVESVARFVGDVLRECAQVAVLATSREPLGLNGEQVWRLAPLSTTGAVINPAAQLFAARARAVRPTFTLDTTSTPIVTAICNRLDGLPLAIELAAARVSVLSLSEILAGLEDRFRLLRNNERSVASRQRTLEGLLDWSYQLLTSDEQAALRRLSVFAGSFDRATATAAIAHGNLDAYVASDLVWSLAEKSLINVEPTANATRYHLFDSIRAFALQRLDLQGELETTACQLADRYLVELGPWVPMTDVVISQRTAEIDNLRGLIGLLARFDQSRAQCLAYSIAKFHQHQGSAARCVAEIRTHLDGLTLRCPQRVALMCVLVQSLMDAGESDAATRLAEEAANLSEVVGVPPWDATAVERALAFAALSAGNHARAIQIIQEALPKAADDNARAGMLTQLYLAASGTGDMRLAHEAVQESLALDQKMGLTTAVHHSNLAELTYRQGDYTAAARHQHAALIEASETGQSVFIAFSMILAARFEARSHNWSSAIRLHASADSVLVSIGVVMYPDDQQASMELLHEARTHVGDENYETERRIGEQLSLPEAIQIADAVLLAVTR